MQGLLKERLQELKLSFGAIGLKAEFEAEGATFEEVRILKDLANSVNLDFTLKIGGCEAIRDIKTAQKLGIKTLVAPMIESEYAFTKFMSSATKILGADCNLWINIETINGVRALDKILTNEHAHTLKGVVFGRTDFMGEQKLPTTEHADILSVLNSIKQQLQTAGKKLIVGGNITPSTITAFENIFPLYAIETRKIILSTTGITPDAILKALEFEILWLEYKNTFSPASADEKRLDTLKERCQK